MLISKVGISLHDAKFISQKFVKIISCMCRITQGVQSDQFLYAEDLNLSYKRKNVEKKIRNNTLKILLVFLNDFSIVKSVFI